MSNLNSSIGMNDICLILDRYNVLYRKNNDNINVYLKEDYTVLIETEKDESYISVENDEYSMVVWSSYESPLEDFDSWVAAQIACTNLNMEIIKELALTLFFDKINNMCNSEISEELYDFLEDKGLLVYNTLCNVLANNECVNTDYNLLAKEGFDYDLILDWESYENLSSNEKIKEMQSTILYNYDALWMTAIHKTFPNQTTDTQCGCGEIDLIL